jgi:uncharacterized cupin superfamily protein
MGCTGIAFSLVRCKRGESATYGHRHKVQEEVFIALKGDGTLCRVSAERPVALAARRA